MLIPKSPDNLPITNFRPISLLNANAKHLKELFVKIGILKLQRMPSLKKYIRKLTEISTYIAGLFFDMTAAFNCINPLLLEGKQHSIGFRGSSLYFWCSTWVWLGLNHRKCLSVVVKGLSYVVCIKVLLIDKKSSKVIVTFTAYVNLTNTSAK